MIGVIRSLREMWCRRPMRVRELHHQRSRPRVAVYTSGKGRRIVVLSSHVGNSLACLIVYRRASGRDRRSAESERGFLGVASLPPWSVGRKRPSVTGYSDDESILSVRRAT